MAPLVIAYIRTTYVAPAGLWAGRIVPGAMHEFYLEVDGDTPEEVIRRAELIREAAENIIQQAAHNQESSQP